MTTTRAYYPALDGIRGAAALFVVARHCKPFFENPFEKSYLAVDVFFLLSGIVLFSSYESRLRQNLTSTAFLVMRLVRLYPLYALGSALGILAVSATAVPALHSLIAAAAMAPDFNLNHRGLFPFNAPAWSLGLEIVGGLAYGFVGYRMKTVNLVRFAGAMLVTLGVVLLAMPEHNLDLGWSNHTYVGGLVRLAFSFTLGIVIGRITAARPALPTLHGYRATVATWMLLAAVGAIFIGRPPAALSWMYDLTAVAVAFPLLVWLALVLQPDRRTVAVCRWLGLVSFPIYALHEPLVRLLKLGMARVDLTVHATPLSGILLLAGLAAFATLVDRVYDRPVRQWLGARLLPKGRGAAALPGKPLVAHADEGRALV